MNLRSLLAAVAAVVVAGLFVFSLWAEWGPYAWIAALQVSLFDSYGTTITFVLTLLLFLVSGALVLAMEKDLPRPAMIGAAALPALALFAHIALVVTGLVTGGTDAAGRTFAEKVSHAGFLPHNVTFDRADLPDFNLDDAVTIKSSRSGSELADVFVPFVQTAWPAPDRPVLLKSTTGRLKNHSRVFTGNLHEAPLPYLVRRSWADHPATFAIVIEDGESVREYWLLPAIMYGVAILYGAYHWFRFWRSGRTTPAATLTPLEKRDVTEVR